MGADRRGSRDSSGDRRDSASSTSSSPPEKDDKKKKEKQGLKADLLQFAQGAVNFLKGSPPQARESGKILELHSTRYKDAKEAKTRKEAQASKGTGSTRSSASSKSSGTSTRASSRYSSSSSSGHSGRGHGRHSSIQRPWQVHGDAKPDMEVEYADEAELTEPSGVSEARCAVEQVKTVAKKARLAAWAMLRKELDVQRMIWESLNLAKRTGGKDEPAVTPEGKIIAEFEKVLKASNTDPDKAVVLLKDTLERDANGSKLLSNSVKSRSEGAIKAETVACRHRQLEELLLEAGMRGKLNKAAGEDGVDEPVQEEPLQENSPTTYSVQELSELLLACELENNVLVYCICRILSWLAGAPESGASITMAMGTANPGDQEDPYIYYPPEPSISPPGSHENEGGGFGTRRLDLTSLQKKVDKREAKEGNDSSSRREAAKTETEPVEPPPSLPPATLLPDFPRYPLSDPFSMIPLTNYQSGLGKDFRIDDRSTTAGSGAAAKSGAGSAATCGSGDGDHRDRVFIAL